MAGPPMPGAPVAPRLRRPTSTETGSAAARVHPMATLLSTAPVGRRLSAGPGDPAPEPRDAVRGGGPRRRGHAHHDQTRRVEGRRRRHGPLGQAEAADDAEPAPIDTPAVKHGGEAAILDRVGAEPAL